MIVSEQTKIEFAFRTSIFLLGGFIGVIFLILSISLNLPVLLIFSLFSFGCGLGATIFFYSLNKPRQLDSIVSAVKKIKLPKIKTTQRRKECPQPKELKQEEDNIELMEYGSRIDIIEEFDNNTEKDIEEEKYKQVQEDLED